MSHAEADGRTAAAPEAGTLSPVFAALTGLLSLGVIVQAILAGEFINRDNRDHWIDAHGLVGDILQVVALVVMVYAVVKLRRVSTRLMWSSVALFVMVVAQAGLGHAITDNGHDGLLVIHIPLALLIFGMTIWQSFTVTRMRRAGAAG